MATSSSTAPFIQSTASSSESGARILSASRPTGPTKPSASDSRSHGTSPFGVFATLNTLPVSKSIAVSSWWEALRPSEPIICGRSESRITPYSADTGSGMTRRRSAARVSKSSSSFLERNE